MPIFRVKSVKIYTGQKKFTLTPSVASVTIIRYARVSRWHGKTHGYQHGSMAKPMESKVSMICMVNPMDITMTKAMELKNFLNVGGWQHQTT